MKSRRSLARAAFAALPLTLWLVACQPGARPPVEVGRPAPPYSARSITNAPTSLADLRGRVVLVNAWATWCKPCLEEIPVLRALHAEYESRGLTIVGVSLDEDTAAAPIRDFAETHEMTYRIWRDPDQRLMTTFDFAGLPTSVLIDRNGTIRWMSTGRIAAGDTTLESAIRRALAP